MNAYIKYGSGDLITINRDNEGEIRQQIEVEKIVARDNNDCIIGWGWDTDANDF